MNRELFDYYEEKRKKTEKEINDYREVDNARIVTKKEKILNEINLIQDGLISNRENAKLRERIRNLEFRLKAEGIDIDE